MKKYINAKYLDKIDNEREEYDLFKKLWKFTFKKTDVRSKDNREAYLSILTLLLERHQQFVEAEIRKEAEYYCEAVNMDDSCCIRTFIRFANIYRSVYFSMTDDFKLKMEQKINAKSDLLAMAFFLSDNPLIHARNIDKEVGSGVASYVYNYLKNDVGDSDARDFAIKLYGSSKQYDDADDYFDNLIEPILGEMSEDQLVNLISYSNNNSQVYDRRRFSNSKWKIKSYMDRKNPQFDYSPYGYFER